MKKIVFGCFLASLGFISCSDDDPAPGGGGGTAYMTTTAGATWTYDDIDSSSAPPVLSTHTLVSTNRPDTLINGRSYHIYTNSNGSSEYYNISGSDYYVYQKLPDDLGGAQVELLYLKTNVNAGATWTGSNNVTVSGFPITINYTSRIAEKGITKVVNGITYNDVIHVETTLSLVPPFPIQPPTSSEFATDMDFYYAPGKGLIHSDTKIDIDYMGIVQSSSVHTRLKTTNF